MNFEPLDVSALALPIDKIGSAIIIAAIVGIIVRAALMYVTAKLRSRP